MNKLFTLFITIGIISAQNSDLYKRPFNGEPSFDVDVIHYEINLKINDHDKSNQKNYFFVSYQGMCSQHR